MALTTALLALLMVGPVQARNVPGSVAVVQPQIDQSVAFAVLDSIWETVHRAGQLDTCENYLRHPDGAVPAGNNPPPCDWGMSVSGGVRGIEGAPDGYGFKYLSGYGNIVLAKGVSSTTTVFGGLTFDAGRGELAFNDGTLEHFGVGGVAGVVVALADNFDFGLLGGAEWLRYHTTRSGGTYIGDYDALRYMAEARLRGLYDGGSFFIEYGGALRFVQQHNQAYREYSGGVAFADVPASDFLTLTGLGNVKLALPMGQFTPYVEGTAYANLVGSGQSDPVVGRIGAGIDTMFAAGKLTFKAGAFFGAGGYQGFDASAQLTGWF